MGKIIEIVERLIETTEKLNETARVACELIARLNNLEIVNWEDDDRKKDY